MSFFSGWTGSNSFGGALDFLADRWDSIEGYFDGSTAANRQQRENEHNAIFQYFANKALQEQAQEFNADQSALAFQRSLKAYRQRYQDTVKDLRAAGLNPLLAVNGMSPGQSPSASPASSSAASVGLPQSSISEGHDLLGTIGSLVSAYSGFMTLPATLANTAADTALKNSTAHLNEVKAAQTLTETDRPGIIGQGYRAMSSIGRKWLGNTMDAIHNSAAFWKQASDSSKAESARSAAESKVSSENLMQVLKDKINQYNQDSKKTLGDKKSYEIRMRNRMKRLSK